MTALPPPEVHRNRIPHATLALLLLVLALAALSLLRTPFGPLLPMGKYFWLTTYDFGFVRRGFLGTIFLSVVDDPSAIDGAIVAVCRSADWLLVALMAVAVCTRRTAIDRAALTAAIAYVALSPLLPYQHYQTGLIDAVVLCLATLAVLSLQAPVAVFAAILAAGLLTHEMIVLLILPLLLLHWRRYRAQLAVMALLLAGVFLVRVTANGGEGLFQHYIANGLSPADAKGFSDFVRFSSIGSELARTLGYWRDYPVNSAIACLYPLVGVIPIWIALARSSASSPPGTRAWLAGCVLLPYAVLAIAFDFSRMAAFASYANFLLVLHQPPRATQPPPGDRSPALVAAIASSAVLYLLFPILWLWSYQLEEINRAYHAAVSNPLTGTLSRAYLRLIDATADDPCRRSVDALPLAADLSLAAPATWLALSGVHASDAHARWMESRVRLWTAARPDRPQALVIENAFTQPAFIAQMHRGAEQRLDIIANGHLLATVALTAAPQTLRLDLPPAIMGACPDGLTLDFKARYAYPAGGAAHAGDAGGRRISWGATRIALEPAP